MSRVFITGSTDGLGLAEHTIGRLADWYSDSYHSRREEVDVEAALDEELRHRLTAEHGVLPEFVETELRRIMDQVFKMPSEAEDALAKHSAPRCTFGAETDVPAPSFSKPNEIPRAPLCPPEQEDDLSIPVFLRVTR